MWFICLFILQNYTQYIPLSIYDLQTWMGSPSIFVYDCSNAGLIVKSFKQFALQREQELEVRLWECEIVKEGIILLDFNRIKWGKDHGITASESRSYCA